MTTATASYGSRNARLPVAVSMVIGGRPTEADDGARYDVTNPANGEVVGSAPLGAAVDARAAIASASAALDRWRKTPPAARARIISKSIEAVSVHSDELAVLLTREQGKPVAESNAEIAAFLDRMRAFVELAASARDGQIPLLPSPRTVIRSNASRVEAVVTVALVAWNFPVGLMAKKLGPALLAGGTVIVKPAFTTPLASASVIEIMNAAGMPPGVLNCVTGSGEGVGTALVRDVAVGRVHVTGSDETGERIARNAGSTSTELRLELAGSNPMIVCADADMGSALNAAVFGRFYNAGQVCTAVKRLYVASEIYEEFVRELRVRVSLREPGDGLVPAAPPKVRMGPLHTAAQRERLEEQIADGVRQGATILTGGRRPSGPEYHAGHFFEPTLLADVPPACKLVSEEVFGPALPVFRTASLDDAVRQANQSRWDLGAFLWTGNRDAARRVAPLIRCRQLWINRLQFGSDQRQG
jgi:acyl-CoA reductase-like NAD-dependent aldehyde dehydrogenase